MGAFYSRPPGANRTFSIFETWPQGGPFHRAEMAVLAPKRRFGPKSRFGGGGSSGILELQLHLPLQLPNPPTPPTISFQLPLQLQDLPPAPLPAPIPTPPPTR